MRERKFWPNALSLAAASRESTGSGLRKLILWRASLVALIWRRCRSYVWFLIRKCVPIRTKCFLEGRGVEILHCASRLLREFMTRSRGLFLSGFSVVPALASGRIPRTVCLSVPGFLGLVTRHARRLSRREPPVFLYPYLAISKAKPFRYSVSGIVGITGWSGDWA